MRRLMLLLAAGFLSGCATRGTLDMDCADLETTRLVPSQLVRDIQSGATTVDAAPSEASNAGPAGPLLADSAQFERDRLDPMYQRMLASNERNFAGAREANLLLSGGGQWGAYGTGFLADLQERGQLPRFSTVTGVSTGALQSLFIGALGDPDIGGNKSADHALFAAMMKAYRPAREAEVVNRSSRKELAVITGSFAGLSPVRGRILAALCDDMLRPTDCPLIARLARSDTGVFLGFVKAADGGFYFSHINAIAKKAYPDGRTAAGPERLATAQRCIAAAALASLAMPVFFQQVRVGPRSVKGGMETYYDGGVRQSVFEAAVVNKMMRVAAATRMLNKFHMRAFSDADLPPLYVVRNGPTVMLGDSIEGAISYNAKKNIIDSALRAESILVNQLEVQSIADLRLANPRGPIFLRTADGFDKPHDTPGDDPGMTGLPWFSAGKRNESCVKQPADAMFSPSFMACIMRFGRAHAEGSATPGRTSPSWITLSPLATVKENK